MSALSGINVETYGNGSRRVVALHCALGRAATWAALARHLDDTAIIAPDWPSHGKSKPWTGQGLMLERAMAIALECIGTEPCDLVGHSYGALVALHLATQHPELVRSLTLIEPIFLSAAAHEAAETLDAYLAKMQPHFDTLSKGDQVTAAQEFIEIWGGGVKWEQIPEAGRDALVKQIPIVGACRPGDYNSPADEAVWAKLDDLRMPILLVHGDKTVRIIKDIMQILKRRLPHSQEVIISKAGHMVANTHAAEIAEHLKVFWRA